MRKFIRLIKQLSLLVLLMIALLAGAWFASENPEKFAPKIFGFELPELSVGIYLCMVMMLGVLAGASLNWISAWLTVLKVKRTKNREIRKLRTDIAQRQH